MSYLDDCTQRILAICKATIQGADGVDHFFYKGSATPYFTMRLGQDDITSQSSDRNRRSYLIVVRYVIGHITTKYEGQNERRLYSDIPAIETAFAMAGTRLQIANASPINELHEALLTPTRGLSVFPSVVGIDGQQVGTEFNIRATFTANIPGHR